MLQSGNGIEYWSNFMTQFLQRRGIVQCSTIFSNSCQKLYSRKDQPDVHVAGSSNFIYKKASRIVLRRRNIHQSARTEQGIKPLSTLCENTISGHV